MVSNLINDYIQKSQRRKETPSDSEMSLYDLATVIWLQSQNGVNLNFSEELINADCKQILGNCSLLLCYNYFC